jgi:hypothetical protein
MVCKNEMLIHWLVTSVVEYAIRRVQVNHEGLKLNGTHQLMVYTDDANVFGGDMSTVNKKPEALVVPREEFGLEVNSEKSKYMVMC